MVLSDFVILVAMLCIGCLAQEAVDILSRPRCFDRRTLRSFISKRHGLLHQVVVSCVMALGRGVVSLFSG